MSTIPTFAEFLRDRVAEYADGSGYHAYPAEYATDAATYPALDVDNDAVSVTVAFRPDGSMFDVDSGHSTSWPGLVWFAEPTDTGRVHGPETRREAWESEARKLGEDAGRAAASWCLDGDCPPERARRVVEMFDTGDPELFDYLPAMPDLSGEWADGETPASLVAQVLPPGEDDAARDELVSAVCDAWEEGVSDAFYIECERMFRAAAGV